MKDYRQKTIDGMICDTNNMMPTFGKVTIRMTSDDLGQSLSLTCANILIEIPLEPVKDIIKVSDREDKPFDEPLDE